MTNLGSGACLILMRGHDSAARGCSISAGACRPSTRRPRRRFPRARRGWSSNSKLTRRGSAANRLVGRGRGTARDLRGDRAIRLALGPALAAALAAAKRAHCGGPTRRSVRPGTDCTNQDRARSAPRNAAAANSTRDYRNTDRVISLPIRPVPACRITAPREKYVSSDAQWKFRRIARISSSAA